MATVLGFGTGVSRHQWYLPGTDPLLLPAPPPGGTAPDPAAVEASFADPAPGTLFDGRVALSGATVGGQPGLVVDALGSFGAVPNAHLAADAGAFRLVGFVHVDVVLTGGADSVVHVIGAKRANILTGGGDDSIRLDTALRKGFGDEHDYRIVAGAGDDTVRIGGADIAGLFADGDASFGKEGAHRPLTFDTSGAAQHVYASLGRGNDVFLGHGATADSVDGGAGRDTIWGGAGDDTLHGGKGADTFLFLPGDGDDAILDFQDTVPTEPLTLFFGVTGNPYVTPVAGGWIPNDNYGAIGLHWEDWLIEQRSVQTTYAIRPLGVATLSDTAPFTVESFLATQDGPAGNARTYLLTGERDGALVATQSFTLTDLSATVTLNQDFRRLDAFHVQIVADIGTADDAFVDNLQLVLNDVNHRSEDVLSLPFMDRDAVSAMIAAAVQDGADTLLDTGDGTIRLVGVDHTRLDLGDFVFA